MIKGDGKMEDALSTQYEVMMKLLFNLPQPTVPVFTTRAAEAVLFPIRRIYCVGRNYREHTLEMGGNPDRELPFFFQKPADSAIVCNPSSSSLSTTVNATVVPYPMATSSLHHEAELIVAIAKDGARIPTESALDHVYGYSIGCDLTRRDLQAEAKKLARPWDAAKGFDSSCPLSHIVPKEEVTLNDDTEIQLSVNGTIRQSSELGKMIYSTQEIISHLSQLFHLQKGDLIMTGTPAGVSDLNVGDKVSITCGELPPCKFVVGPQV